MGLTKDSAFAIARTALRFRRDELMKYWLDSFDANNRDDMTFWAESIESINESIEYLLTH